MITLDAVSAWYGDVIALNDVSARIEAPILGLLGPNGAGKSTLLALIAGLRSPNSGTVLVDGRPPRNDPTVLGTIGIVPEPLTPPRWLTGRRFVADLARMNGMNRWKADRKAREVLDRLGLTKAMDRPIRGYSQGMRQRVKLAQALVHEPRLLLLDEPFTGLDPPGRAMMTRTIEQVAAAGTQVIFSSHVLAEVEGVTKDVLMLMFGRVLAQGSVREVRTALSSVPLRIGIGTSEPRTVAEAVIRMHGVEGVQIGDDGVTVSTAEGTAFLRDLTNEGARLPITRFGPIDEDLESVYQIVTQRRGKR
jgi:ABC-2 type transport system ATP-binding protein